MGSFIGQLDVVFLNKDEAPGQQKFWMLDQSLTYVDTVGTTTYTALPGFITDFASVPRVFWSWLPKAGEYSPAAVIHDWIYFWGVDDAGEPVTRGEADAVFRRAMADLGVPWARRWAMWSAVRLGGRRIWNIYRAERA